MSQRSEIMLLVLIVSITAVLRMGWPGITEFKADEARLMRLALEMANGATFPVRGISSSVGFPNFPMSVWLYALPLTVWQHPYAATLFTGLLNTLAVVGCYWLVRRYYGVEAALSAALMFAVSPWAIHHSRKIWAQNLLPFFVVGWGIAGVLAFIEKRPKWLVIHFLALAIAAQAHLAAFALVPVTGLLLLRFWRRVDWKWCAIGIGAVGVTVLPFAYYLLTAGQNFLAQNQNAGDVLPTVVRGWDISALRYAWLLTSGQEIHALTGPTAFEAFLAKVPETLPVHWLWGAAVVGGVGVWLRTMA
ncbi:MAG: glycosyltransferase family 39 protein, partial [Anaerolineales bacterium]|nr:glycosyltransferase family 39 protein [Anaerolineales bacterium]